MIPSERIKLSTLALVAARSLFLEASWNNQGQQNLGLAAAIDPALLAIHGPGEALGEARLRALDFFNTNPIASGLSIGVIIRQEEELAAGRLTLGESRRMAANLNRTLAAMGDALFWQSWLPLCSLTAVWAVLSLSRWWTPLALPVLFCLPALPVRFGGLFWGYRRGGDKIVDLLFKLQLQRLAQGIKRTVALVVGASTVILLSSRSATLHLGGSPARLWLTVGAVVVCVLFLRLLSARTRVLNYWYPLLLVSMAGLLLFALDRVG